MGARWLTVLSTGVALLLGAVVAAPAQAAFPGREGRLAFVRANQIFTILGAGGTATKLTTTGKNSLPTWSPDGKRIAYIGVTATGAKDVYVMSSTGTGKVRVTTLGNVKTNPTWSPDGTTIAFGAGSASCTTFGCKQQLYAVRSTAPFGVPTALTGFQADDSQGSTGLTTREPVRVDRWLAWSPDGTRIALNDPYTDAQFDHTIYFYDPTSGAAHLVTAYGASCCGDATVSDLTWGPTGAFGWGQIYTDPASGVSTEALRFPATGICCTAPGGFVARTGDRAPAPSPSGAHLAFVNATSGTLKVFIATSTGAQRRFLTNGYQPDWQPLP